jgi:hypothetical protein
MGKISGSRSGSGMNSPDHNSESSETIFWVIILKFFDADPGWKKNQILDPGWKKFGSGINIPDPQHCPAPPQCNKAFLSFLLTSTTGMTLLVMMEKRETKSEARTP